MRIEQKLSIPLAMVAIGNLTKGILRGGTLFYYLFYCGIFLFIAIGMQFFKLKKSDIRVSILLLIISLVAIWLDDIRSLFGLMLLTYSLALSKNNSKTYWVYGSLAVSTIIFRFAFYSLEATDMTIYLSGSAFILIVYQHYIYPKIKTKHNPQELKKSYKPREVKDQVVDIVHLKVMGYDWPEINDKLELNVANDRVRRIVADERKRLGFKNQDEFIFWLTTSGIIQPQLDDLIIKA